MFSHENFYKNMDMKEKRFILIRESFNIYIKNYDIVVTKIWTKFLDFRTAEILFSEKINHLHVFYLSYNDRSVKKKKSIIFKFDSKLLI